MAHKRTILVLMLLAAALMLSACGTKPAAPTVPDATAAPAAPEKLSFSVNDANTVLLDKDGIKITFVGMEKDDYEYTLKMTYENTTDKDYDIQLRDSKLDGKEGLTVYSDTLKAQSTSEGGISLPIDQLTKEGITEPGTLEASIVVLYDITEEMATIPVSIRFK